MLTVPDTFRQMPRWWSDASGRRWLGELPGLVAEQCRRWELTVDGTPWHGSNALVVPVRRRHEQLALRLSPPGDDVAAEARALRFWDGRGTVQLVEADVERSAMLLERLDGSRSLLHVPLDQAVTILAGVMLELALPAPEEVPSTNAIAAEAAGRLAPDWERCRRPTPRAQLERVLEAAQRLARGPGGERAVNGDLHYEQVLAGTRAPWLVVDPVLLRGDMEYDLARLLWSRLDEMSAPWQLQRSFDAVVEQTGVPRERARDWVAVRSMSYLLWGIPRGLTTDPVRCRRLLDVFS